MKKANKWIWLVLALVLLVAAVAVFLYFFLPYYHAKSEMPANAVLTLEEQADGSLRLSWPIADRADYYSVEVVIPGETEEDEETVLLSDFAKNGAHYILNGLPSDQELLLRVNSVVCYSDTDPEKIRLGETPVELPVTLAAPKIEKLEWEADEEADTVTAGYSMAAGDNCRVYVKNEDGSLTLLKTVESNQTVITFGENADLPMPDYGASITLAFDAYRERAGMKFYGYISQEITIVRDDLLGRDLGLQVTDEGYNVATLTWNETKGESYRVEMKEVGVEGWTLLGEIPMDGERTFTTNHLPVTSEFIFRVLSVGGQTMPESEYAAVSDEIAYTTIESPIYATIWPTSNLKAYSDPEMTQEVGTVKVATAYCVLDEVGGAFAVGLDGEIVYIDSNYCMINLPEYIGDLCSYNITNSYSSIYMVHEYEIPKVTAVVTAGYERVRMANGEYLVPLLYPTAKKLTAAAKSAIEQGYRLKIYDAYRPNMATREIYSLTEAILDEEIPERTFKGGIMYDLPKLPEKENEEDEDPVMTYRLVMTNGTWSLGSFLANGGSLHNLGIAVDLTLETLDGKELGMQTSMHDLSFYSTLYRNNANANTLAAIMKGAGLGDLISEWWHFQDNDSRKELNPPTVWQGVTPECWMKDDFGWKYRRYNGTYFVGGEYDIYGTVCTFDENGYVVTE